MRTHRFNMILAQLLAALACAVAWPAAAQATADHSQHATPAVAAPAASADWADAEVRKIDLDTGKVTLKHGNIKALDMPPMTMVFGADKTLLAPLKVGDKVRFQAAQTAGRYTVTAIQPAP